MNDEIDDVDDIYEITLMVSNSAYWVNKETYDMLREAFGVKFQDATNFEDAVVKFDSVDGSEVILRLANISDMSHTTREQRTSCRARTKRYREMEGLEQKKEDWEL